MSTSATPSLPAGYYSLTVRNVQGCSAVADFHIEEWPKPVAQISTPDPYFFLCPNGQQVNIYALETEDDQFFQWFQNGQPVGTDSPILTTGVQDDIYVVVTNQRGCKATSNIISFIDCEDLGGTCVNGFCSGIPNGSGNNPPDSSSLCIPQGNLDFSFSTNDCKTFSFQNLSTNFIPNSFIWDFGDPASNNNSSTATNPTHVFSSPGYYHVWLFGKVPSGSDPTQTCNLLVGKTVLVPLQADFHVEETCAGLPTQFTDLSTFVPNTGITAWHWDFGDAASGTGNISDQQHASHVFTDAGTYTITLEVTSTEGCTAVFFREITVHEPPVAYFNPPQSLCAATALNFMGNAGTSPVSYEWDFGDSASGNGNVSQNQNTWHVYPDVAVYPVTLTVSSPYGCESSYTSNVAIEANDLSGEIDQPVPICEGGSTTISATEGGISWVWSNTKISKSISISQAGVYSVTLTNSEGCTYSPPPVVLEVLPPPVATIRAVELNVFGQPITYHEGSYTACEGEDVFLEIIGDPRYQYEWSGGGSGEQLSLTGANNNLLPVGNHSFSVTITDVFTGCSSVEGPFPITVHGLPTNATISSDPPGPLCGGAEVNFWVENPDPALNYLWNTGQLSTTISALAGGTYLVLATNQFGCQAKSNEIEIHNVPNVGKVTSGCYNGCIEREICLPESLEIAEYQWFLNGNSLPAPAGTVSNYIATEDGEYQVLMTSIYGCESLSDPIYLSFDSLTGDVIGQVWLDLNDNGAIDSQDSLLSGITIDLLQNGNVISQNQSGINGQYIFGEISATGWQVQVNFDSLSLQLEPIFSFGEISLTTCGDSAGVDFLLKNLCFLTIEEEVVLAACPGGTAEYNGETIAIGETKQFVFNSFSGCDSTVSVFVEPIVVDTIYLNETGCPGGIFHFQGMDIETGTTEEIVIPSFLGCDSTIIISVEPILLDTTYLFFETCANDTYNYGGSDLLPGTITLFVFPSFQGCDSLILVTVDAIQVDTGFVKMEACNGETSTYNGQPLQVGSTTFFTQTSWAGCDSTVIVSVNGLPVDSTFIELEVCGTETIEYQGFTFAAGDEMVLELVNQFGCDSLVFISVNEFPELAFQATTNAACPDSNDGQIELNITVGLLLLPVPLIAFIFSQTLIFPTSKW
ncbi:MAG: PKD domain-containing protein, partial [Saprospiraceae bacterium]